MSATSSARPPDRSAAAGPDSSQSGSPSAAGATARNAASGDDVPGGVGNWIAVGVIRGAFGVQGALKVEPYTDIESSVLNRLDRWRIVAPAAARPRSGAARPVVPPAGPDAGRLPFRLPADVTVENCRQHGGVVIATLAPGISREQAIALKGAEVAVERADFPAPEADEYYWADLIGCAVSNPAGVALGQVLALDDNGAQAVLRLDSGILIPFVAAIILEVSPAQKRIVADWSADWL
jgi:16S rRNA processing protein RimM